MQFFCVAFLQCGGLKNWQCQFCSNRCRNSKEAGGGKAIAYEYIEADQLKPGDLIFYAGYGNGRYKNIDHVSMYYGSFYLWEDLDSGAIIHAVGSGVQFESYSWYCSSSIVMIARPVE